MDDFASQQRPRRRNLTDKYAKLMKGRQGIVASYNALELRPKSTLT